MKDQANVRDTEVMHEKCISINLAWFLANEEHSIGNVKCVCVCVHVVSHLHWGNKKKKKITEDIQLSDVAHRLYLWGENNLII